MDSWTDPGGWVFEGSQVVGLWDDAAVRPTLSLRTFNLSARPASKGFLCLSVIVWQTCSCSLCNIDGPTLQHCERWPDEWISFLISHPNPVQPPFG